MRNVQRFQGIGLFFIGLSALIAIGTIVLDIKININILIFAEVVIFLIGVYYFGKSELMRRGIKKINNKS